MPPEYGNSIRNMTPILRSNYWLVIHVLTIASQAMPPSRWRWSWGISMLVQYALLDRLAKRPGVDDQKRATESIRVEYWDSFIDRCKLV